MVSQDFLPARNVRRLYRFTIVATDNHPHPYSHAHRNPFAPKHSHLREVSVLVHWSHAG